LRPVQAILRREALAHNLARVRALAPASSVMAVLKANAYGHGLMFSAGALPAADAYGVLDIRDAIELREADFDKPICLLEGLFADDDPALLVRYGLQTVVHSDWQLRQLEQWDGEGVIEVWLKVETGMKRLGFEPGAVAAVYHRLEAMRGVRVRAIMSHLANADDTSDAMTTRQLAVLHDSLPKAACALSLANSAAVCGWPQTHMDWVRPGIMLYGSSPLQGTEARELDLQPVMTLQSEVIACRMLQRGDAVGYGGTWTAPEPMRIGIIACGYGDGYPRHAPNGTPVHVEGRVVPLVGRVSMDMIAVDLRGHDEAGVGSVAEMWGRNLPVDEVARHAATISYELMCGITARVRRVEV